MIRTIEVSFAVPVELTSEQYRALAKLVDDVARAHAPEGCVHWLFGQGSKPQWSQADSALLGKPVDPNAPERGEPTFDDSVLYLETSCRER